MIFTEDFSFDRNSLSNGMGLSVREVTLLFRDAGLLSRVMEPRLATRLKGSMALSKQASYDVIDSDGKKWEVRCMNKNVNFTPSADVGSGRKFSGSNFTKKLGKIDGYIVCDATTFPQVRCYLIPKELVRTWWHQEMGKKAAKISRKKFLDLLTWEQVIPRGQNKVPVASLSSA